MWKAMPLTYLTFGIGGVTAVVHVIAWEIIGHQQCPQTLQPPKIVNRPEGYSTKAKANPKSIATFC